MAEKKKKGIWQNEVGKRNQERSRDETWVEMKGFMGNEAGKTDNEMATLRAEHSNG